MPAKGLIEEQHHTAMQTCIANVLDNCVLSYYLQTALSVMHNPQKQDGTVHAPADFHKKTSAYLATQDAIP